MTILSDALKANNTYLTSLNLQGNRLKATEATELFQALALNTTLTELSLFDNNISDTGATELSKALLVNNALAKLDLAKNQIGDTGAAELSKALMVNTVLTKLHLYNKNIGDVGTLALGNTLRTRPHPHRPTTAWHCRCRRRMHRCHQRQRAAMENPALCARRLSLLLARCWAWPAAHGFPLPCSSGHCPPS